MSLFNRSMKTDNVTDDSVHVAPKHSFTYTLMRLSEDSFVSLLFSFERYSVKQTAQQNLLLSGELLVKDKLYNKI